MRNCLRCGTVMTESGTVCMTDATAFTISLNSKKTMRSNVGRPLAAVCPKCGEVSLYIPDVEKYVEKFQKYGDFGD
ncbi:MAG: nucleic acid-binding protein [Ruminococcus sp.]|nr:nucleic acid-binding protein [Ruminococcus sp.]